MIKHRLVWAVLLAIPVCTQAEELDLFDWMGVAPIVVQGDVTGESGRYIQLSVVRVLRGELEAEQLIHVNLRRANRERQSLTAPLKLPVQTSFLLLLKPAPPRKKDTLPAFYIVRGVRGAREIPAEGSEMLLAAAEELARIQNHGNEIVTWNSMRVLLEDTNPLLIATSVSHHMKFRRGDPDLLAVLRPLLDHPRPDLRESATRLIGQILERHRGRTIPEDGLLQGELAGRARRDPAIGVRVAATEALDVLGRQGTEDILKEIALSDPDQLVRYTAQKLLYERREQPPSGTDDERSLGGGS